MPLVLNIHGNFVDAEVVKLEGSSYGLKCLDGITVPLACPLQLTYELDSSGYDLYVYFAGDVRESDIRQIHVAGADGDARVGWFIPLLSLESDLHDYAGNEHFLRYARAAVEGFFDVLPQSVADSMGSVSIGGTLSMTSFSPESTVLMVISKKVVASGVNFDASRLYPYLSSVGILDERQSKSGKLVVPFVRSEGRKLRLVHCANEFSKDNLAGALITYAAHAFSTPVLQFFYLYQVMELLMERVFSGEQKAIVEKINQANGAVARVKEAMADLNECLSEKNRINAIVEKYCDPRPDTSDLVRSCRDLNAALGIKEGDGLAKSLYPLRNLLFHDYRSFPDQNLDDLREVNLVFFSLIVKILESFKSPE